MIKVGMRQYKEREMKGFKAQVKKIHEKIMSTRINKSMFTQNQCVYALQELILLKEKRCGKIKDCICADIQKQKKI